MKCGQEVQVIDPWGSIMALAVSQCGGGFLAIVHGRDWRDRHDAPFRNGERLYGWEQLLDRLVWLAAHAPENAAYAYMARSAGTVYTEVTLHNSPSMPLLASNLAKLLEADPGKVHVKLREYLVIPEPVGESEGDHADEPAGDPPPALG